MNIFMERETGIYRVYILVEENVKCSSHMSVLDQF